ncbi:AsmA family protein [Pseudodesulfovibrio sp. JC047]|uniref:AsmA family protein n=1 Tax=Pseudodesulfovibrio sp. JC047 TaxID=2683199 RepID=UPI0013D3D3A2|nr:AsmA family protein [Pseudodesulfovibrio sp. JC047]NDV19548.1 AsmA family protein [Pseudodesulfovibrio sp. JC047]
MNKALKYSVFSIGLCVALFLMAAVVFISVVDPNDYKDRISRIVLDETGRTLTFEGDLNLLVFPNLGIRMTDVSLSNTADFGPEPMIRVASASVSVRIAPLLMGKVKFGQLVLDELVLNMGRAADGTTNWEDLVGRQVPTESSDTEEPFSLEVAGLSVTNGSLVWDDRYTDTQFVVRGLDVSTGKIAQGAVFPVDVSLKFACSRPDAQGTVKISGKSSIDFVNREYGHLDMGVQLSAKGKALPGGTLDARAEFNFLALDFNRERAQVTGLKISAYGATVRVDGTFEGITQDMTAASGVVKVDPFDVKKTLAALGKKLFPIVDKIALTDVGGMVDFAFVPGRIDIKTLKATVDGTRIVGNARIERGAVWPTCFMRLDVGTLDLDKYMPVQDETKSATVDLSSSGHDAVMIRPALLRKLDVDIEAKVAKLKLAGVYFESVIAHLKGKDGVVRLSPASAQTYGGSITLDGTVSVVEKTPSAAVTVAVDSVDIGALSRDADEGSQLAGIADFNADLTWRGERVTDMRRTVNGTVGFFLKDGVFPGVNMVRMARETHDRKSQGGRVEAAATDSTRFGTIKGTGVLTNGVLVNEDLEVVAPGLRANGHGAVSLVTHEIDYIVKAKLVPQATGQGGKGSDDLFGVLVPIHVTGTVENPHYWVSVTEYVKALGGTVIGVVGSVLGGVTSAIKEVGSALDETCCEDESTSEKSPRRKKFLGIF